MSVETTLFQNDCYGCVLTVKPFGESLPDWIGIEVKRDDLPDDEQLVGFNAVPPAQIEALRDALTDWLDEHPVRPDPFADGGSVEWAIGSEVFTVTRIGDDV